MAPPALVNFDIENGQKAVEALDDDGKAPKVALWAKLPDYESWRLILASDLLDQASQLTGYTQIGEAMEKAGIPIYRQPSVLLRPMNNPMIENLRRVFAVAKETYGMRLGGQTFGDKYIEDAFVYRIR
ncbi:MAG: hypothetical protein ACRD25_10915 [Terracidiphilus sp.]